MTDDERRICRRLSFGCHVADSDVAPEMCGRREEIGDLPIVDGDNVKRCHRQTTMHGRRRITWASWLMVVVGNKVVDC